MEKISNVTYSISPDGNKYALPTADDYKKDFARLATEVKHQRELGREIVVVLGLGFVGAVMAGVIADAEDSRGRPSKFVIGVQRPSVRSFWKINIINKGVPPFKTEDPKVDQIIRTCVLEKKNLVATYTEDALKLADVVVVDIQCDYHKDGLGHVENGRVEINEFKDALHSIGKFIPASALVLIETTVPPGTTEHIAYPIIKAEFVKRGLMVDSSNVSRQTSNAEPLLAHSYERVMPGKDYVDSIRNYWRVCSGINAESREKVVRFLNEVLNTKDFPLMVMDRPIESETSKIVENSYRATLLAFMNEWSLFAEQNGVDIIKVIKAIKVRPTHSNIMFPGPGVGGYCLPKDGALGMWAYENILGGKENILKISTQAININDTRPLHVIELLQEALKESSHTRRPMLDSSDLSYLSDSSNVKSQIPHEQSESGRQTSNILFPLSGIKVAVLGASYREDVGDTRYSGSEIIVRRLVELGAEVKVHDPYCESWAEFEAGNNKTGRAIFFRNQAKLDNLPVYHDLNEALAGVDVVILAVRHQPYLELFPDEVVSKAQSSKPDSFESIPLKNGIQRPKNQLVILDCFGILADKQIRRYLELGCVVKGLGRGHISRL
jgi:nucleotide sugar dehydrogenase